jgi:chromosomal replication initiator protein
MQQIFEFPVSPKFTFDNFVVCVGNRAAAHFARQLASEDGSDNLLYIYGPPGSGKTHLLSALGRSVCDLASLTHFPYFSFKDVRGELQAGEAAGLADRFTASPILLLDDIHLIPDSDRVRLELWQLFNDFYRAGKKIAITGLLPPRELPRIDDHLVSRLLWGLVAKVDISDDDSRRMILEKLATDRQVRIPAEVYDYLVLHAPRDIPALVGALEAIRRHSFATQRKITVRLAREALAL